MADVAKYNEVELDYAGIYEEYNGAYYRAYEIYLELQNGEIFEDDLELVQDTISNIDNLLATLKSDYLINDQDSRETEFEDSELKHYRAHFGKLKRALQEELDKLQGGEVDDRRNAKQTEAIHAQISALKAMKEQIDEQINALSKAL